MACQQRSFVSKAALKRLLRDDERLGQISLDGIEALSMCAKFIAEEIVNGAAACSNETRFKPDDIASAVESDCRLKTLLRETVQTFEYETPIPHQRPRKRRRVQEDVKASHPSSETEEEEEEGGASLRVEDIDFDAL